MYSHYRRYNIDSIAYDSSANSDFVLLFMHPQLTSVLQTIEYNLIDH